MNHTHRQVGVETLITDDNRTTQPHALELREEITLGPQLHILMISTIVILWHLINTLQLPTRCPYRIIDKLKLTTLIQQRPVTRDNGNIDNLRIPRSLKSRGVIHPTETPAIQTWVAGQESRLTMKVV